MTETTLNHQQAEINRKYITYLLKQLTVDYQKSKQDMKKIASISPGHEEFTVLEEIELSTVNIRGYASQIQARGRIENEQEAIERLQNMRVFDIPVIAQFYFATDGKYGQMKAYIRMLDYLRLLILEYLRSHKSSPQESSQGK